jgi:RNA polymerase sigma-70 factor (ECF subfamily)
VQAAIAAVHAEATDAAATDWRQIAALYSVLLRLQPTPVIELNHAVAVSMADGPEHGLRILDRLESREELATYHLFRVARAELLLRLGRGAEATQEYQRALGLAANDSERRHIHKQLAELASGSSERPSREDETDW